MMKIRDIYPKIIARENLYRSAYMASRGRRYRDTTADFNFCLEEEVGRLHDELSTKSYRHGEYRLFTIYDPKERKIAAAPFRDRVVHHAAHDIIEPFIDKTFIHDSYACRKNKGSHKAIDRACDFLKLCAFCLHGDIKKYFYSINHAILKEILRMRIEDKDLLWLLDEIIDSANGVLTGERVNVFAGSTREPADTQTGGPTGLPIGNLTSQFFANLYLNELDYFVKFDLRITYYLRYMDDFLIFGDDKKELVAAKNRIRHFLKERLALNLHKSKSQVYKTRDGIKFLGFRLYRDYRRLASDNVRRFRKRMKKFAYLFENTEMDANEVRDSVRCWVAHSKYADTKKLRSRLWSGLKEKDEPFANLLKDILLDGINDISERERERERERE
jgi:retron-type reverse transcriptase